MSRAECVIFAFRHPGKAADAFVSSVGVENILAAGEYFVRISLVADIPNEFIFRRIESVMNGSRKFNRSEAGTKMARVFRDHFEDKLPYFLAQSRQFFRLQLSQIVRRIDL